MPFRAPHRPVVPRCRGSVATEYGLTLLFVSLAIILAATGFVIAVSGMFDSATPFPSR